MYCEWHTACLKVTIWSRQKSWMSHINPQFNKNISLQIVNVVFLVDELLNDLHFTDRNSWKFFKIDSLISISIREVLYIPIFISFSFECRFWKLADELEPKNIKILHYDADLSTMHIRFFWSLWAFLIPQLLCFSLSLSLISYLVNLLVIIFAYFPLLLHAVHM
jgi:hypothetical protein